MSSPASAALGICSTSPANGNANSRIVYLVGPYRDLVATLRKGLPPRHAVAAENVPDDDVAEPAGQSQDTIASRQARTG